MEKIGVVLNAAAGSAKGEERFRQVSAALEAQQIPAEIVMAERQQVRSAADRLIQGGCTILAAGGGDGTMNTVASALVNQTTTLAVLPLGTLNHFAKDLGIPIDVGGSVKLLQQGKIQSVDLGSVNGRIFLNNSSLGLYPDEVQLREKWRPRLGKWGAAVAASAIVLARYKSLGMTIELKGAELWRRCDVVMIGNNQYAMALGNLIGRKSLCDHCLGIYLLHHHGRRGLFKVALRALFFRPQTAPNFESFAESEVLIRMRRRIVRVALDGEVEYLSTPLRYRVLPSALRVLVPENAS